MCAPCGGVCRDACKRNFHARIPQRYRFGFAPLFRTTDAPFVESEERQCIGFSHVCRTSGDPGEVIPRYLDAIRVSMVVLQLRCSCGGPTDLRGTGDGCRHSSGYQEIDRSRCDVPVIQMNRNAMTRMSTEVMLETPVCLDAGEAGERRLQTHAVSHAADHSFLRARFR